MDTIAPTTPIACPACNIASRKFGKDRKGNQRYQCPKCEKTFVVAVNPLGDMRIGVADAARCLHLLLEGTSLRAAARLSGVNRETILNLMVLVGERCEGLLEARIRGVGVVDVECDEIWGFVGMKEKTRVRKHPAQVDVGDCYCFTAIERESKLLLTWHLGTRTPEDTQYLSLIHI